MKRIRLRSAASNSLVDCLDITITTQHSDPRAASLVKAAVAGRSPFIRSPFNSAPKPLGRIVIYSWLDSEADPFLSERKS